MKNIPATAKAYRFIWKKKPFRHLIWAMLCLAFVFMQLTADAQKDSIRIKDSIQNQNDSISQKTLEEYNKRLKEIEEKNLRDSIKRANLEKELQSLKTTDNLKKEALQKQIEELSSIESRRLAEKKQRIDSIRTYVKSYPVIGFFEDTLFNIYTKLGSISPKERSARISKKVSDLGKIYDFSADSLVLIPEYDLIDIAYDEIILMSISDDDAIWNNTTKDKLAESYKNIIGQSVTNYKQETSFVTLAKEIGLALLVIAFFVAVIIYTNKLFIWFKIKISEKENVSIKGVKLKNYVLLEPAQQVKLYQSITSILKWVFFLILAYLVLPVLFGIFPWTQNVANELFGYILDPLKDIAAGIWNYLPNLFTITIIIIIFRYILKGLKFLKSEIEKGHLKIQQFYPDWANPTYQIIRVLLLAFLFILIFPYLPGSNSPIFKGVSVFLGVLFTFGSSGPLSNIIAGFVLTYMRAFNIGDRIKIGDITGDVIEKSMLVTRIRTTKNEIISIPNSSVMNSHTINFSSDAKDKGLILHTTVTIGYDVPWQKMHAALIEAANRTTLFLKDPAPFVLQTSLDDFYVSYQINAYTREPNKQAKIYSELHQHIQDCCNEAGIEIMSPHYRAARDGNQSTIPSDYLGKEYKPPSFNLNINKDSDYKP